MPLLMLYGNCQRETLTKVSRRLLDHTSLEKKMKAMAGMIGVMKILTKNKAEP